MGAIDKQAQEKNDQYHCVEQQIGQSTFCKRSLPLPLPLTCSFRFYHYFLRGRRKAEGCSSLLKYYKRSSHTFFFWCVCVCMCLFTCQTCLLRFGLLFGPATCSSRRLDHATSSRAFPTRPHRPPCTPRARRQPSKG